MNLQISFNILLGFIYYIKKNILFILMFCIGGLFLLNVVCYTVDAPTKQFVQSNEVPCFDSRGNEFKEEVCFENITCSKHGLAGDYKCSEILMSVSAVDSSYCDFIGEVNITTVDTGEKVLYECVNNMLFILEASP